MIRACGTASHRRREWTGAQWTGGGIPMSSPACSSTHRPSSAAFLTTATDSGLSAKKPWYSGWSLIPFSPREASRSSSCMASGEWGWTLPKERSPGIRSTCAAKLLIVCEGRGEVAIGITTLKSSPAARLEAVSPAAVASVWGSALPYRET